MSECACVCCKEKRGGRGQCDGCDVLLCLQSPPEREAEAAGHSAFHTSKGKSTAWSAVLPAPVYRCVR